MSQHYSPRITDGMQGCERFQVVTSVLVLKSNFTHTQYNWYIHVHIKISDTTTYSIVLADVAIVHTLPLSLYRVWSEYLSVTFLLTAIFSSLLTLLITYLCVTRRKWYLQLSIIIQWLQENLAASWTLVLCIVSLMIQVLTFSHNTGGKTECPVLGNVTEMCMADQLSCKRTWNLIFQEILKFPIVLYCSWIGLNFVYSFLLISWCWQMRCR